MTTYTLHRNAWIKLAATLREIAEFGPKLSTRVQSFRTEIQDAVATGGERVAVTLPTESWESLEDLLHLLGGETGRKACAFLVAHRVAAEWGEEV